MRRCKLCVKFKTHCWRRTCGLQAEVWGGGELKRIMLHLSRVSASPPLLAAVIVANKRQTKYSETESRRWPTATATPCALFLPPASGSVSTHLARFVGERDMYMRNYIVDFRGGSSCRRCEGVGRRSRCCLHAARCFHARLRCSGSGQDIAVAFFLFDFLFVFFLFFSAVAVLHLWPTQQEDSGLDSHWE